MIQLNDKVWTQFLVRFIQYLTTVTPKTLFNILRTYHKKFRHLYEIEVFG